MEFITTWSSHEALQVSARGVGRHGAAAPVVGDEQCTVSYHTPAPITMKLLVDTRPPRPRVVFAEAGKDAVDFLFSLLTLPAGTAVRLLGKESMAGSVGNLYSSVERLEGSYLRPGFGKDALLCPAVEASPLLRLPAPPAPAPRTFFTCGTTNQFNYQGCRGYVSDARGARCPACRNEMATQSQYVAAPAQPEQGATTATTGYVQGGVTYTVTDDLAVTPMSAISSIRGSMEDRDLDGAARVSVEKT